MDISTWPRSRHWLIGRTARLVTAALGCLLLVVAAVTTVGDSRTAARDRLDHDLTSRATAQAILLGEYFERARTINLILSRNPVFEAVLAQDRGGRKGGPQAASGTALTYLESLYPGRISEACLIARDGRELSRVTRGVVAPASDLSPDESKNPFFAPTVALSAGKVYQSSPYVSPDTDEWVISNSTPIVDSSGAVSGILHFEVLLESFAPQVMTAARDRGPEFSAMIVDIGSQRVVLDQIGVVSPASAAGDLPAALQGLLGPGPSRSGTLDQDVRAAAAGVEGGPDNANSWYVVVTAPASAGSWISGVSLSSLLIVLAAMLLFAFAAFNLRSTHMQLQEASLTDELTGLPNRRLLGDRLDQALLLARRRHTTSAMLLIDLDRFKEVNDTLGHHHGDQLLRAVADRLASALRASDTVARLGGDEFAILLPEVADEAAARDLAGRCLDALHETFTVEGVSLNVEASIGLALAPQHGTTGHALLRAADVAMYEAKGGHGSTFVYDPSSDVHTPHRLALLGELRHSLHNDELVMYYQPKVDFCHSSVVSVEALVRWRHPTRGLIPPDDFIPIAEGTGLMMPLTLHTLELAVAQARVWWSDGRSIQVAVNLSPRCLRNLHLPDLIKAIIDQHGLPAHLLRLEITESTVMADPAFVLATLTRLKAMGIALSIDDFGTGYSSMSYLKRLPVDELKIDRTFVTDMLSGGNDDVLVRSSIDLAHNLGLSVVAEGVEDQATVEALEALGCDVVQGYHLGRPMPATDFDTWLVLRSETETARSV